MSQKKYSLSQLPPEGTFAAPGYWQSYRLQLLTEQYAENEVFREALDTFAAKHEETFHEIRQGMRGDGPLSAVFAVDKDALPAHLTALPGNNLGTLIHWC